MKMILVVLAAVFVSQSVFADSIFRCGSLRDAQGHVLVGGPGYSVVENGSEVTLLATNGSVAPPYQRTYEFPMTKVEQEPDAAVYEADGIRATFTYLNGARVSIESIDNSELSAPCTLER